MSVNQVASYNFIQKQEGDKQKKAFTMNTSQGQVTIWDTNGDGKLQDAEIAKQLKASGIYSKLSTQERVFLGSLADKEINDLMKQPDDAINGGNTTLKDLEKEERTKTSAKDSKRRELLELRRSIDQDKEYLQNLKQAAKYQQMIQKSQMSMAPFGMGIGMGMGMGMLNPFFGLGGMLGGALGGGLFNSFMPQMPTMQPDFSQMENNINERIDEYNAKLQEYGITDKELVNGTGDIQLEETPQLTVKRDKNLLAGEGTSTVTKIAGGEQSASGTGSATTSAPEDPSKAAEKETQIIEKLSKATSAAQVEQIMKESGYTDNNIPTDVANKKAEMEERYALAGALKVLNRYTPPKKNNDGTVTAPATNATDSEKRTYINNLTDKNTLTKLQNDRNYASLQGAIQQRINDLDEGKTKAPELGAQLYSIQNATDRNALEALKNDSKIDMNALYVRALYRQKMLEFVSAQ